MNQSNPDISDDFLAAMENPRHRLISVPVSPVAEMARWIFELYDISYAEEAHAPVQHLSSVYGGRVGYEIPVVITPECTWTGAREFLINFDAKSPPGRRLLGEDESERAVNMTMIDRLLPLLSEQVCRYFYFHLISQRHILKPIVTERIPFWEKFFVEFFYSSWSRRMNAALDFSSDLISDAPKDIEQAFDLIEERLGDGRQFLAGNHPNIVDVVFSSLSAPVIFPPQYGVRLPEMSDLPPQFRDFVLNCRNRRAGQLVLDTYKAGRTEPQPLLSYKKRTVGLATLIFSPAVKVWLAKLLVRFFPRIVAGPFAIASRWKDVQDIFKRDTDFLIAPINAVNIEEINGPFVLGMDRSELMLREQRQMYAGLSAFDAVAVRAQVRAEAQRLLAAAQQTGERKIEVVNGYARLIAARTAVALFGVDAPSEAEYMTAVRRIFHHAFLNVGADAKIRNNALAASKLLRHWTLDEIARRHSEGDDKKDIMSALLALQGTNSQALDDDGVRRTLMGMLVGAVDTTATAVAHCTAVLLSNDDLKKQALRDADNPDRFLGWCWEALRFMPHNAVLARFAPADTSFIGKKLKRDTKVVINILGAMHDTEAFPSPHKMNPERPLHNYFHFGGGLHPCAGRAINAIQVPELVRQLLIHNASYVEMPRFDGPFVDEFLVQL